MMGGAVALYRGITWATGSVSSVHYGGPWGTMGDHHSTRTGTKLFAALDCRTFRFGLVEQGQVNGQTRDVGGVANQVSFLWIG